MHMCRFVCVKTEVVQLSRCRRMTRIRSIPRLDRANGNQMKIQWVALGVMVWSVGAPMGGASGEAARYLDDWELIAISEDGKVTAVSSTLVDAITLFENTEKSKPVKIDVPMRWAQSLALSSNGKMVALSGYTHVRVVRTSTKPAVQARFALGRGRRDKAPIIHAMAFSLDDKLLAVGGDAMGVVIIDLGKGEQILTLGELTDEVSALSFSPDGKSLAVGFGDGRCQSWSVGKGEKVWEKKPHREWVSCLAFFPDGKRVASGSWDGTNHILDAASGKSLAMYDAHRRAVNHLAVSPDGKSVVSHGLDRKLHFWSVEKGRVVESVGVPKSGDTRVAFGKGGQVYVATGGSLRSFDPKTKELHTVR